MQKVVHLTIALLAVGIGTALAAQLNYTGEWKLNAEKSDFGMAPPISSRTDKIVHKDPSPADHSHSDDRRRHRNERV
jgi:hypothetical protein